VRWLDFHFDPTKRWPDAERKGLDFLPEDDPAFLAWADFWPRQGTPPNWDAVGIVRIGGADEWLLVEAKAHAGEMISACQAGEAGGLPQIRKALNGLKRDLGVADQCDWLSRYYQFANRLAVLNFLTQNGVPARLLFVYFVGDNRPDGILCPQSNESWEPALLEQARWLGLEHEHRLSKRIHKLFLPVSVH